MEKISSSQARSLLTGEVKSGRFFSVDFTKRSDGSERLLNGHKNPAPDNPSEGGIVYDPSEKELVPANDVQVRQADNGDPGYRMVPLEGINKISARGKEYTVES